jgi:aminopeptidase N
MGILKFFAIVTAVSFFTNVPLFSHAQNIAGMVPVEKGVPERLAVYRAGIISQVNYDLTFNIPATVNQPIPGLEQVLFYLKDISQPLQIDFKADTGNIRQVEVNGSKIPVVISNEHLIIKPQFLVMGLNKVMISFIAGRSSLNRNNDFLYTLLVPDRARTVFPCFDQPDLKAVFTLTLTVPHGWKALANAPLKDSLLNNNGYDVYHFSPSDTISTYLFSFVAGKFFRSAKQVDGRTINFYYRETDSSKLKSSINPIFDIQGQAIQFMEGYTQIKYPFKKFDCVAIPDFQYGGMEHVGAIQYKASALFLDESATKDQLISRANVLAHETAHTWFGDLVSVRWFNDVWMKEVFANFMADKTGDVSLSDNNFDLKFLTEHYPLAYNIDRTAGSNPIRQTLDNLQDAGSLYGNIIYQKAPIMMRQLEMVLGPENFRDGLRAYLKKYAYHNASWPELIAILASRTPVNLQAWNKVWVNEPGRPQFTYSLKTANNKITGLVINQRGEDGSARIWPQYFKIALVYPGKVEELPVNMNKGVVNLKIAAGKAKPRFILFNSSGQGYGVFPVDANSIPYIPKLMSPLMRASAYINLYENMLNGQVIKPAELLKFDSEILLKEPEELNLNVLLDQLSSIFWRFIPAAKWGQIAPGIENTLWHAMQQAVTANEKKQLLKAYNGIAFSKAAQDTLFKIWKTRQPPNNVKLTEDDYTGIATTLAIRNYTGYREILSEQVARIQNPDRKQRLLYLMPALSDKAAERDAFFATLKEAKNRRKEAWVITAISYLHHPLRTEYSEKYLQQSLDLLEDIQRTGDVFFPQSWLQATFNWYQSPAAATIILNFLASHPGYNPKLKAKILQSADNVFRAGRLVQ